MGLTGVIFGCIAAAWLVYLVPYFLHHRGMPAADEAEPALTLSSSVTIVRSGASLAEAEEGAAAVSTPLTRRAALRHLKQIDSRAAQRRRRVLLVLLAGQLVVGGLAVAGLGAWWGALIPAGLIVAFLVVARFSVKAMRADLAERAARISQCPDEETVALAITPAEAAVHEHSVDLGVPVAPVGSLWDPIPITRPTYVSKPLAPRTVRTIDLSAPVPTPARSGPVTADAPVETDAAASGDEERRRDAV